MQQQQKIFSIEEADVLVPFIKNAFSEIFSLNEITRFLGIDISDLVNIWGKEISEPGNVDYELYKEKLEKRNQTEKKIQEMFDEISKTGAVVKDMDVGLVDFYSKNGDELVMLCWKFGEDRIRFWHPASGGFSRRKPVEELKR